MKRYRPLAGPLILIFVTIIIGYAWSKNQHTTLGYDLGIGYGVFYALFIAYYLMLTAVKLTKLKWHQAKKRLSKFAVSFVVMGILSYIVNSVTQSKFDTVLFTGLFVSFLIAWGISFGDLIFPFPSPFD